MKAELEQDILLDCVNGNTSQFGLLYDHYLPKIYRFIYYKTMHKETAEDLTSEVFMKALDKIQTFQTDRNFSSWLYQIAHNTVIDYYRTRKATYNIEDVWDLADESDLEGEVDNELTVKKVKELLEDLTPEQRDVVIMRVWSDMSYAEIAEVMNKKEGNCKMIYSRAVAALRSETLAALAILLLVNNY